MANRYPRPLPRAPKPHDPYVITDAMDYAADQWDKRATRIGAWVVLGLVVALLAFACGG